jgi:LPS-assembly lipoprotein
MTRYLLAAAAALLLSACGFHLRGALSLPEDLGPIRVIARDPYSPLAESLAQALSRTGGQATAEGPTEGMATLRIRFEKWGNTPISVDVQGRSQEYTLRYATIFDLQRADGSVLVPEQSVELARDYISVPTRSEGTESEREILTREMQREMVASILRRIDAVVKAPQPASSDTTQTP